MYACTTYHIQFLKSSSGERLWEILSIKEWLDLDPCLMLWAERSLCLLNFSPQLLDGPVVSTDIFTGLLLVELHEVLHDPLVKVLSSEMGVSVGSHHLKHSVVDGEERDVKGTSTEIKNEDILLSLFLVKTVGDGGGGSEKNKEELVKY